MTNDRELMQQALDALTRVWRMDRAFKDEQTIEALRARLAQPEPEPVAWMHPDGRLWTFGRGLDKSTFTIPLYAAPPQREWQGLTDEEIMELVKTWHGSITLASAVEAKLKAKNAT
jgi:hypothetical protein